MVELELALGDELLPEIEDLGNGFVAIGEAPIEPEEREKPQLREFDENLVEGMQED